MFLRASIDRPVWVSDTERGMFHSYKHKHRRPRSGDDCIVYNYYGNTVGFATRVDAVKFMEK